MRKDMRELLDACDQSIEAIAGIYERARSDAEITELPSVTVKNTLENLRSVLEYAAYATRLHIAGPPREGQNIYFPCREKLGGFNNAMDAYFPRILVTHPALAAAFRAIQPFETATPWLSRLFRLTNDFKHLGAQDQKKQQGAPDLVIAGNAVRMSANSSATFVNCSFNGHHIPFATVRGDMTPAELAAVLPIGMPVHRVPGQLRFEIGESGCDALELLRTARGGVEQAVQRICREIGIG